MSLPQIWCAIAAADRRDASLALQSMEATHAANAPLQCGTEGSKVFKSASEHFRSVVRPSKTIAANSMEKLIKKAEDDAKSGVQAEDFMVDIEALRALGIV